MQVGTTKDQGLYNKSSAAVHPGALAAETLPQYNTIQQKQIDNRSENALACIILHEWSCQKVLIKPGCGKLSSRTLKLVLMKQTSHLAKKYSAHSCILCYCTTSECKFEDTNFQSETLQLNCLP